MTPAAERLARLREFQHGRAPELAALTEARAAANLAALERRRSVADGPQSAQGMLADAIRVLAAAVDMASGAGVSRRPVCERCTRTLNLRGRTCRYCGHWNPRAVPIPERLENRGDERRAAA